MLTVRRNINLKWLLGLLILILMVPTMALAVDIQDDRGITIIRPDETIKGPAFYSGNVVQIEGTIDGSLFVAAKRIKISGIIKGDIFTASQDIEISGTVEGDLHSAAADIQITGQVQGDAMTASEKIFTGKEAIIKRDVMMAASQIVHTGQIQRQMLAAADDIIISGSVNDDVRISVNNLELQEAASINGDLKYKSPNQGLVAGEAKVSGKTHWQKVEPEEPKKKTYQNEFVSLLFGLAGALLLWFLITIWRPKFWYNTAVPLLERPLASVGVGALALMFTPLVVLILMVTIVGLPVAIITGLTYGVALYVAKIVVAVSLGYWLANRFSWPQIHKGVWLVLLGLSVIAVLTNLPAVGFFFKLLIIVAGLGSLVLTHWRPAVDNRF